MVKAIKMLLAHPNTTNDMLYSGHIEYGSCLTLAARYQINAVKSILTWDKLSWKIVSSVENKQNFLSIACRYNSEAVKYALESKWNLQEFLDDKTENFCFFIACRYQPDAVKYILDSNYGTKDLIYREIDGRTCLDEAFELQPKAFINILTSKHGGIDILNHEDEKGYKLYYKINRVFDDADSIEQIVNLKIASYTNIVVGDGETHCCDICYTYKPIVIFQPCFHMSCIGCAFKLRKCHKCRALITDRRVLYD